MHQTFLRLNGDELTVVPTDNRTVSVLQTPMLDELCGAPIQETG